jgi:phosphatidylserine decarboxylase
MIQIIKKYIILGLFLILIFILYFLRYPTPIIRKDNFDNVYSPAFGKVMSIIKRDDDTLYLAIFLNPMDIHYQFYPVSGTVSDLKYDCSGKFDLAYELNKSNKNEKSIYTITNKHGDFIIYQIAGFLVRRISTYNKKGDEIESGQCMGVIYLGSRVDIIIPKASTFNLLVKEGDKVKGFNSLLGYYTK